MSERIKKINDLIRDILAKIVEEDIGLPIGIFCTIAEVDTAPDLKQAKVWMGVFPSEKREEALAILNKNIYEIQGRLNRESKLRYTPRISFSLDKSAENVTRVEELLKQIKTSKD